MKKVIYFGLFVMTLFVMASCSPSTPGAAAKQYAEYIQNSQFDKLIDGIAVDESMSSEAIKQQKEGLTALFKEKGSKQLEKKQGIKNIEIISEEIAEDGNTATVKLKFTYGNEEVNEEKMDMIKRDGKWLWNLKK